LEFGLVVNQNAQLINAQLFTGSLACGGNLSLTNTNVPGSDDCNVSQEIPFDVASFKPSLIALSLQLAALSATGSVSSASGNPSKGSFYFDDFGKMESF